MRHTKEHIERIARDLEDKEKRVVFCIKNESTLTRRLVGMAASRLGYYDRVPDKKGDDERLAAFREKIWSHAERVIALALAEEPQKHEVDRKVVDTLKREIEITRQCLELLQPYHEELSEDMDRRATDLPGQDTIKAIPGLTVHGLSVFVGQCGNLWNFLSPFPEGHKRFGKKVRFGDFVSRVWKRTGVGLLPGREEKAFSTWVKEGGLSKEEYIAAGYKKSRLGRIMGVIIISGLWKHKAKSVFGEIYDRRRARTALTHPEWYLNKNGEPKVVFEKDADGRSVQKLNGDGTPYLSSQHAMMDGQRIMLKRLVKMICREWWDAAEMGIGEQKPFHGGMPAAAYSPMPGEGQTVRVREDQVVSAVARQPNASGEDHATNA